MTKAKKATLLGYDRKIKWGKAKKMPFSQGWAINEVIKTYKIPAKQWGYTPSGVIGVATTKQKIFWKDKVDI